MAPTRKLQCEVWRQEGSGAWFLAVSYEHVWVFFSVFRLTFIYKILQNVLKHHMITPDGYNVGRDLLLQRMVGAGGRGTVWKGMRWVVDRRTML